MTTTEVSDNRQLMQSMDISAAASVKTIAGKASDYPDYYRATLMPIRHWRTGPKEPCHSISPSWISSCNISSTSRRLSRP